MPIIGGIPVPEAHERRVVKYRHPEVAAQSRCACGKTPTYYVVGEDWQVTEYCPECGDAEGT